MQNAYEDIVWRWFQRNMQWRYKRYGSRDGDVTRKPETDIEEYECKNLETNLLQIPNNMVWIVICSIPKNDDNTQNTHYNQLRVLWTDIKY